MGRTQGQTLTRSTKYLLYAVLLLAISHVSTASPPLAQVDGDGDPPIGVSLEKEILPENVTEVSRVNETAFGSPSNATPPMVTPAASHAPESKTNPGPPAPEPDSSSKKPVPVNQSPPADPVDPEVPPTESVSTSSPGETCGINMHLEDEECVCDEGFTTDGMDSESFSKGCLCIDQCAGPRRCPSKTSCTNVGCGVGYRCECEHGIFDVVNMMCKGVCDFFGNAVCGEEDARVCKQGTSLDDFTCECADGYTEGPNRTCTDVDECLEPRPCKHRNEECKNTPGGFTCNCKEGYVRNEVGDCEDWNECLNPEWNTCDQRCDNEMPGELFACFCYDGFSLENDHCVIDDESRECECESMEEGTWICRTNDEEEDICLPKPGFHKTGENTTEDIDECTQNHDLCGANSACTNEWGFASCSCLDGFVSSQDNGANCVALECPIGQVPLVDKCVDPCSSSPCGVSYTCRVSKEGTPECHCGVECLNQFHMNSTISVYSGTLTILRLPGALELSGYSKTILVASLEAIFGRGTIDVTSVEETLRQRRQALAFPSTGDKAEEQASALKVRFDLMTEEMYDSEDDVAEILKDFCDIGSGGDEDSCALPGGVVVRREDIVMINNANPCKADSCPSPHTKCTKSEELYGRYTCECVEGFEPAGGFPRVCEDVDECVAGTADCKDGKCINTPGSFYCTVPCEKPHDNNNDDLKKQLEESEQSLTVVSAVLGTLLCLALIASGVLFVLKNNKPRRQIENVDMSTTTPVNGFDNGGFHQ